MKTLKFFLAVFAVSLVACSHTQPRPQRLAPASTGIEQSARSIKEKVTAIRKSAETVAAKSQESDVRSFAEGVVFSLKEVEAENDKLAAEILKYKGDVKKQTDELNRVSNDFNEAVAKLDVMTKKHSEAVSLLWKWRLWFLGENVILLVLVAGGAYLKFLKPI